MDKMIRWHDYRGRVIVSLDTSDTDTAHRLVKLFGKYCYTYKAGMELVHGAAEAIHWIHAHGVSLFIDLKFHDTPRTVASAIKNIARHEPDMVSIHAAGGRRMIRAAKDALFGYDYIFQDAPPLLLGVTMLTSIDDSDLHELGWESTDIITLKLAAMALDAGCDGLIASGRDVYNLREEFGKDITIVVPGCRPEWAAVIDDDQKRTVTPSEAIEAGADYVVIGRPVTQAPNPEQALVSIFNTKLLDNMTDAQSYAQPYK